MLSYQAGSVVIGRFELRQKLGVGGMGIVFGAMDRKLDEEVALKFLPPAMAGDQDSLDQFAKEVKRARKVSGKYILRVYDIWDDGDGGAFVTMEWAKGGDLNAYRKQHGLLGLLTWDQVRSLMRPILLGLQAVHEAGIVHRDVKPANILFREDGTPVVADFGISKSIQASMSRISQDATISGTPAYMAPEAVRGGEDISPPTDLYAVGCMTYELLTGHTPFTGDPMSIMYNQTHADPSFRGIEKVALAWVGACLLKEPSRRVQTAEELIRGLDDPGRLPAYAPVVPVVVQAAPAQPVFAQKAPVMQAPAQSSAAADLTRRVSAAPHTNAIPQRPVRPAGGSAAAAPKPSIKRPGAKPKAKPAGNWLVYAPVGLLALLVILIGAVVAVSHKNSAPHVVGLPAAPTDQYRAPAAAPGPSSAGAGRVRDQSGGRSQAASSGSGATSRSDDRARDDEKAKISVIPESVVRPEDVKPRTEIVKPRTEVVKPQTEIVKPRTEVVKPQTEIVKPRTEVVKPPPAPKVQAICPSCLKMTGKTSDGRCTECGARLGTRTVVCPNCKKWTSPGTVCDQCGSRLR